MRKHLVIAAAALAFISSSPVLADWTGKNAAGTTITFSNGVDCTIGTCIPIAALVNAAGATAYGTAGSSNAAVLSVQGIASGTAMPVSGTVAATQSGTWTVQPGNTANTTAWLMNVGAINGVTPLMGNGATGTGSQRVTLSNDNTIPTGWPTAALQTSGNASLTTIATNSALPLPVQTGIGNVNIGAVQSAGSAYETVAASQTAQALGATGATGDYLSHCVIYPASTSPGVVTVFDNANAAATNVIAFAGGATSTSNLTPISVPVGALSTAGAWKVTTGASVSVTCYGKFT